MNLERVSKQNKKYQIKQKISLFFVQLIYYRLVLPPISGRTAGGNKNRRGEEDQ